MGVWREEGGEITRSVSYPHLLPSPSNLPTFHTLDYMNDKSNVLNWFEIPVADFGRAKRFYEFIFDIKMTESQTGPIRMGFFPAVPGSGKVSGALCYNEEFYKPSVWGPVIYLNANPDLQVVLDRVDAIGGRILMKKKLIAPDAGYMALFVDCEGNRMALHSNK